MQRKLKRERAFFQILRWGSRYAITWPPDPESTPLQIYFKELGWWLAILNLMLLVIAILLAVFHSRHDPFIVMKALSELMIVTDTALHIMMYRNQRPRLKILVKDTWDFFCECLRDDGKIFIVHKYLMRYLTFHVFILFFFVVAIISFVSSPGTTAYSLPVEAWYPFPITNPVVKGILFLHQSIALLESIELVMGDLMIVTFIACASAKFEVLSQDFATVVTEDHLHRCIRVHQKLLRFVREIERAASTVLFKTIMSISIVIICGAFQLLQDDSLTVVYQFSLIVTAASLRLYSAAWSASDLTEVGHKVAWAVYDSPWIDRPLRMKKTMKMIMLISQKPLLIAFKSVIVLSLRNVASFHYMTITYFTTLKAIIHD